MAMAAAQAEGATPQAKPAPRKDAGVLRHILNDEGKLNVHPVYRMEIPLNPRVILRVDVSFAAMRACVAVTEAHELDACLNVIDKLAQPGLFFAVPLMVAMKLGNPMLHQAATQCYSQLPWAIGIKSSNGKIEFHVADASSSGIQDYRLWIYTSDEFRGSDKLKADMKVMRSELTHRFDKKKVNTKSLWADTAHAGPVMDHMPRCDSCDVYWDKLLVCGGCRGRRYCSKACQKAEWKASHKNYCQK